MTERHAATFTVPASHPSLPGHFPGTPVVPGVVLLDLVLRAASEWQRHEVSVSGLKQAKFLAPLLPEERADVALEVTGEELGFRVSRGEQLIAQGTFVLAPRHS
jgi:3-hydroxymyristoyl/3-hydroxydecanoyl-(acyl carrier protein) dehydratase